MQERLLRSSLVLVLGLFGLTSCVEKPAVTVSDRWATPAAPTALPQLPRLAGTPAVDGDFGDWAGAACVPVRYRSYIASIKPPHEWRGPADAGMEVYYGWSADGLCLGAIVTDDDVTESDSVTFYVDGRTPDKLCKMPYSLGFYQLTARPSGRERKPAVSVSRRDGKIVGLQSAGKRTQTGYAAELLIPWEAFPDLSAKAGVQIGLLVGLDDYDTRDGKLTQPLTLSYRAMKSGYRSLSGLMKWQTAEKSQTGAQAFLGPIVALDFPTAFAGPGPLPISAEAGKLLSGEVGAMRIVITDSDKKPRAEQSLAPKPLPAPWGDSAGVRLDWPAEGQSDGFYTVTAYLTDKRGQPLGMVSRPAVIIRGAMSDSMSRIQKANVADLSQKKPFKAAQYLGAAACVERMKRGVEIGDILMAANAAREVAARLDLLETGVPKPDGRNLYDLLALSADPEAQVVVEFSNPMSASVSFCCGGVPFAAAMARKYNTADDAKAAVTGSRGLWNFAQPTTVNGRPARVATRAGLFELCRLSELDPAKQVLLVAAKRNDAYLLDLQHLANAQTDAAAILPDCPPGTRQAVTAWAAERQRPLLEFKDASRKDYFLVAGNAAAKEFSDFFKGYTFRSVWMVDGLTELSVAAGDRVITCNSPSRKMAEGVVDLVAAGKPIATAQADALREALAKEMLLKAGPVELDTKRERAEISVGDLHAHTLHTDGSTSPVALALQAMYCNLDFLVIGEHNTTDGAQVARALLGKHGFAYPLIVGEEITCKWGHANAYPLKEVVSWKLSPEETVAEAHKQGAAIQWNHPDFVSGDWALDHVKQPLTGTGFDAWEHVPPRYQEWKKAGTLPVITGTTDTHSGLFGGGFAGFERTLILAPVVQGEDLARAVREKQVVALSLSSAELLYGPKNTQIYLVWQALADGRALKAAKAEQLRKILQKADLMGLLRESQPRPITPDMLTAK